MEIQNFSTKWIKFNILILFIIAAVVIFINYISILLPFIISIILAFLLLPVVDYFERLGFNRTLSVALLFGLVFIVIGLFSSFAFPSIKAQTAEFIKKAPEYKEVTMKKFNEIAETMPFLKNKKLVSDINQKIAVFINNITENLPEKIFAVASSVISLVSFLVLVPFTTFLLLKDSRKIKRYLVSIVPNRYFEMTLSLIYEINNQLRNYIKGLLLECSIVAILSMIGLLIVGIKSAVIIGAIAGITNIIPYLGPFVGASIGIIISLLDVPTLFNPASLIIVLKVIVVFLIVQQIDNIFISPSVVGKSVNLHPLLVVFALIIGAQAMGIFGMLIAVPLLSTFIVTFKVLYQGFKNYHL